MKHESKSVQVEALWALGNMICVANDVQKSSLLTREVISSLVEAIPNSDEVEGKLLLTVFIRIIDRPEVADYRHQICEDVQYLEFEDTRIIELLMIMESDCSL